MKNSNFKNDLEVGQIKEHQLMVMLDKKGFTTSSTSTQGKFSGYDIQATKEDITYYIESKFDRKSTTTDNIAVELYTITSTGNIKNSGLSATLSNIYAYSFPDDKNFYLIQTKKLKALAEACKDIRRGGDANRITMAIIPKPIFIQHCYILTDKTKMTGLPL